MNLFDTITIQLVRVTCYKCGVVFGMGQSMQQERVSNGESFWCPNGHEQAYVDSREKKLQKQVDDLNSRLEQRDRRINNLNDSLNHTENRVRAMKAVRTKLKKRMSEGKCPCCSKTFADLKDHMKSTHPEYK